MYLEDFKRELVKIGIEPNKTDPGELRDALVTQLANAHPDKTGGTFHDKDQEARFLRIKRLLEHFDSSTSVGAQMIPINQVVTLVEVLSKLQANGNPANDLKDVEISDRYKIYLKRKYALPKITSAVIASLCFALFSLLGTFRQNPLYRSAVEFYAEDQKTAIAQWMSTTTDDFGKRLYVLLRKSAFANEQLSKLKEIAGFRTNQLGGLGSSENSSESLEERFSDLTSALAAANYRPPQVTSDLSISLFESEEPDFLRSAKARSAQLTKSSSVRVTELASVKPMSERSTQHKDQLNRILASIGSELTMVDSDVKSAEEQLVRKKAGAVRYADSRILWRLAFLTVLACLVFVIIWSRERSDERWVDFLATDEGAETVLTRLCANSDFMDRKPPAFSLAEFNKVVVEKDVPKLFAPFVGARLDRRELGKISAFLLERLKTKKVVSERTTPGLQTWFDVHVQDGGAVEEKSVDNKSK